MIDLDLLNEQQRRVLIVWRQRPIRQQDFDKPAIDGGKPIKRVAARVLELKQMGCTHRKSMVPASSVPGAALVAEYTLLSEPSSTSCAPAAMDGRPAQQPAAVPSPPGPAAGALFNAPRCAIYDLDDFEDEAA